MIEQLLSKREGRLIAFFRNITPGQRDAVEGLLAKMSSSNSPEQDEAAPLPANVITFRRKA